MPLSDWTVTIVSATAQSPTLDHYAITLSAGARVIKDIIAVSGGDDFNAAVRQKIADIEAADVRRAALQPGLVVIPPAVSPPPPPPPTDPPTPTPEEQAKITAQLDKSRLRVLQDEIALGIRKADDAEYVALLAKLIKAVDNGALDVVAARGVVVEP